MSIILGKLTKVEDLRTVWKHEALDFTRWLAEPNNMALLSEAIGLDIATVQVEDNVSFILCPKSFFMFINTSS